MGGKICLLLLLALVCRLGFGEPVRRGRQVPWWQMQQRSVAGQGHLPRWGSRGGIAYGGAGGFNPPMPQGTAWSYYARQDGAPSLPPRSSVRVDCGENVRTVTVQLKELGNGRPVALADLTLGPQACPASAKSTSDIAVFENPVQDCAKPVEMNDDWIIYSTFLTFTPHRASSSPIYRVSPATVSITCLYSRHGNVSSDPIKPTWVPFMSTLMSEEKLAFSLQLMNKDWSNVSSSYTFSLGDLFHIEASVITQNHIPMILYVDRCVASLTQDPTSTPNYAIIAANGCLVDGMQEDASSAFLPRLEPNKLRFSVDAFRFLNEAKSTIFITCSLRAVPATQTPDSMNKACSYKKATSSWTPVEGTAGICQCCSTGTCSAAPIGMSGGQSRWASPYRRTGGMWKREADGSFDHGEVALGPILVVGAVDLQEEFSQASPATQEPKPLELWVLVALVSVSMVVVAAGVTLTIKYLLNKFSCKNAVEK